ncbi:hypothetical protein EB796_013619 [Bugula neritina]|uniref:Uncharacterized protein n=1 Tax=Bugula neritina TaxID=10212 RepID=A0A7J7JP21_BUGNE|nr:hypothetical protein EB796_013619 [Bugula neritina]
MSFDNGFWLTIHRVDLCYGSVSQKRETSQTKQSMKWIHHVSGSISKPSLFNSILLEDPPVKINAGKKEAEHIEAMIDSLKKSGVRGATGRDGKPGKDGEPGKDGKAGEPGKDGKDGKDGERGKDGKDGKDGEPGKDGKDGERGRDGKNGFNGKDGKDGVPGKDGKDGEPSAIEKLISWLIHKFCYWLI